MQHLRIFFEKQAEASYISHLDLQRVMARALRRSGLPVWYSQGFNPHIYMSFSLPLPLGQESVAETVDVKTESEETDFSVFLQPLNAAFPSGIKAKKITFPQYKPADISFSEYSIWYDLPKEQVEEAVQKFADLNMAEILQKRKKTEEIIDLKKLVKLQGINEVGAIQLSVPAGNTYSLNPALFTEFLEEKCSLPKNKAEIMRLRVLVESGKDFA